MISLLQLAEKEYPTKVRRGGNGQTSPVKPFVLDSKHGQIPEVAQRLGHLPLKKGAEVRHIGKAQAISNF